MYRSADQKGRTVMPATVNEREIRANYVATTEARNAATGSAKSALTRQVKALEQQAREHGIELITADSSATPPSESPATTIKSVGDQRIALYSLDAALEKAHKVAAADAKRDTVPPPYVQFPQAEDVAHDRAGDGETVTHAFVIVKGVERSGHLLRITAKGKPARWVAFDLTGGELPVADSSDKLVVMRDLAENGLGGRRDR